jgi:hypothetical protein
MKNHRLYVHPHATNPSVKLCNGKSFHDIKAKRKDVPPMHRENIGEIVLNVAAWAFFILFALNCILFFATEFGFLPM